MRHGLPNFHKMCAMCAMNYDLNQLKNASKQYSALHIHVETEFWDL